MTASTAQRSADTFDEDDLVVARGLRAWTAERDSMTASRERWKLIGAALKIGRGLNTSDKLFGQWCAAEGFKDVDRRRHLAGRELVYCPDSGQ